MANGSPGQSSENDAFQVDEDYLQFNSEAFLRELAADLNDDDTHIDGFSPTRIPVQSRRTTRPRLTNTCMLKGLVERTENYNKTVDRKVMTDARIAFEEEQLKSGKVQDTVTNETADQEISSQNISKKGRGDCFGKLRSADTDDNFQSRGPPSPSSFPNSNNNYLNNSNYKTMPTNRRLNFSVSNDYSRDNSRIGIHEEIDRDLSFRPPHRYVVNARSVRVGDNPPLARHQFNPATAYNGKITPDYRFNYNPQAAVPCPHITPVQVVCPGVVQPILPILSPPIRPGQRYPKRPDNNPQPSSTPKQLNHNYYQIELYGATQEERIAQRIEKTVRQTETPPQRF